MKDHYDSLGLRNSASAQEIRRAYRILARRYHPDVNPEKNSEERFKEISSAYQVLSDPARKRQYDFELERHKHENLNRHIRHYERAQKLKFKETQERVQEELKRRAEVRESQKRKSEAQTWKPHVKAAILGAAKFVNNVRSQWKEATKTKEPGRNGVSVESVSIVEVSLRIDEAISGVKKAIEIPNPEGARKVSVSIPPGIRDGGIVRLRAKENRKEELVILVRIASHPFLKMERRGLVLELPISINEAVTGASITVPTLDDQVALRIPAGTQSGTEFRLRGKGVIERDAKERGDLFVRVIVKIPEANGAVGLSDHTQSLEQYYPEPVRGHLPKSLLDVQ